MYKPSSLVTRLSILTLILAMCVHGLPARGQLDFTGFQQMFPDATDGSEYLYEATYKDYDYESALTLTNFLCSEWTDSLIRNTATDYLKSVINLPFQDKMESRSCCAEVRKGNYYGRNLDGFYNNYANLVIRIEAGEDRLASIGMGRIESLGTKSAIDNGILPNMVLNAAPMFTSDGINSAGVCVSLNSLPRINMPRTTGTNPGKPRICEGLLPRVILDKAHSVQEALDIINNNDIFAPYNPTLGVYRELHYIIADPTRTVVVEIFGNKVYVQEAEDINTINPDHVTDANIMTNMWHSQWETNDSLAEGGVERYEILKAHYNDVPAETATAEDMLNLMKEVWFTQGYYKNATPNFWVTDQMWVTPWCDMKPDTENPAGIKARNDINNLLEMIKDACDPAVMKNYRPSTLEGTLHTAVYDMENKSMLLVPAETDKKLYYSIESNKE